MILVIRLSTGETNVPFFLLSRIIEFILLDGFFMGRPLEDFMLEICVFKTVFQKYFKCKNIIKII